MVKKVKHFRLKINKQSLKTWNQLENLIITVKDTVVLNRNKNKALDALISLNHAYPFNLKE